MKDKICACGRSITARAKQCRKCWALAQEKLGEVATCIDCGVEITSRSARCHSCARKAVVLGRVNKSHTIKACARPGCGRALAPRQLAHCSKLCQMLHNKQLRKDSALAQLERDLNVAFTLAGDVAVSATLSGTIHATRPVCRQCRRIRLSVVDVAGVCMFCREEAELKAAAEREFERLWGEEVGR